VAKKVAEIKKISLEELGAVTTKNAEWMYNNVQNVEKLR
jgi:Tat protein secretion system quality control protein TatD with DNase activity